MKIYTLNIGQGQFVVITGDTQAIIIDTYFSYQPKHPIIHVKSALTDILKNKYLVGLMITGFDDDHFNEDGLKIVLNKYRPDWIMYPEYFKETKNASKCFDVIGTFDNQNAKFKRCPILLGANNTTPSSKDFSFEIFSPHTEDMNSSNNCSLVCKITEKNTGATYLVTGDTENDRWNSIVRIFGNSIKADVLDAPHHGSKNGITEAAMKLINPHTVLISAGVDNQFGHPDSEAMTIFRKYAKNVYSTKDGKDKNGHSLMTEVSKTITTYLYT
jgi:beta-lactamase superfamily II metal-dependent hydrolase